MRTSEEYFCSVVQEVDIGDFSVIVFGIIESSISNVIVSSGLEIITIIGGGDVVKGEDFIEDLNLFFEVSKFVIEFIGGIFKFFLSICELALKIWFLMTASGNIVFINRDNTLESDDISVPFSKFSIVDFNFMLKFAF